MVRWILGVVLLLGAGCLRQPQQLLSPEVEQVVWYAEDLSHGLQRDPFELVSENSSKGMQNVALWALSKVNDQDLIAHPTQLQARIDRWPILQQGIHEGVIVLTPDGLLRLLPSSDELQRRLYVATIRKENLDRLAITNLLLGRGQLDPRSERGQQLIERIRQARLELGTAAGAQVVTVSPETDDEPGPRPEGPRRPM